VTAQLSNKDDNSFLARARYSKGRKSLQAILDATFEIVTTEGLAAASQDAIAKRANVTKSAVRHYFPTKEELLLAFFTVGIERLKSIIDEKLSQNAQHPREKLLDIVATHYDWINDTDDIYYFESAAFWGRNPEFRNMRENWYQKMAGSYCELVKEIHPEWSHHHCDNVSFQILTLILGGWITMGSTRPTHQSRSIKSLKATLLDGIENLIR